MKMNSSSFSRVGWILLLFVCVSNVGIQFSDTFIKDPELADTFSTLLLGFLCGVGLTFLLFKWAMMRNEVKDIDAKNKRFRKKMLKK